VKHVRTIFGSGDSPPLPRPKQGVDNRSIQHVMDIVQQYEESYGRSDHAAVVMRYRINGKAEQEWRYPAQP
jgi:hypothetical protein